MRLDKFITSTGILTRSECKNEIKKGLIKVNDILIKDPGFQVHEFEDIVTYKNVKIIYDEFTYILLNKPQGYISATDDPRELTVLNLLPIEYKRMNLFPCGRLDKDTTGLLLLTNNGDLAHRLLSPKYHVDKTYYFTCFPPLSDDNISSLEKGVAIGDIVTKPSKLTMLDGNTSGYITITEGKFHQIKRMFNSVGSEIKSLKRVTFANLKLVELKEGEFRKLTNEEIEALNQH